MEVAQDQCRRRHRAVVVSSHGVQWALVQQALRDCKPWGHMRAVQRECSMLKLEQQVVLGTAVCH